MMSVHIDVILAVLAKNKSLDLNKYGRTVWLFCCCVVKITVLNWGIILCQRTGTLSKVGIITTHTQQLGSITSRVLWYKLHVPRWYKHGLGNIMLWKSCSIIHFLFLHMQKINLPGAWCTGRQSHICSLLMFFSSMSFFYFFHGNVNLMCRFKRDANKNKKILGATQIVKSK